MPSIQSIREVSLNQNLVLTRAIQGIKTQDDKFVGEFISPRVPVATRTGQLARFDNSNTVIYDTERAPGAETKRRRLGYFGEPYALKQDALEGELPREVIEESQTIGGAIGQTAVSIPFNLEQRTIRGVRESLDLKLEYKRAAKLTDPAEYDPANVETLTGTDQLDDPTSDIIGLFNRIREGIAAGIIDEFNSVVMGRQVFNAAIDHPQVRAYIAGATVEKVREQRLAEILGVSRGIRVARARRLTNGTAADFEELWGKVIVAAYVPESISMDRLEPAFSYTYGLQGYPLVEDPYMERNPKTMYYPVTDERECYVIDPRAGYLVLDAVS